MKETVEIGIKDTIIVKHANVKAKRVSVWERLSRIQPWALNQGLILEY